MHCEKLSDVCMALNSIRQTYSVWKKRESRKKKSTIQSDGENIATEYVS
jgi:hypothetical protein